MAGTEPRAGCGAAIVEQGRILLLQRLTEPEAGCWGLPGGKIELFETATAAVEREVAEELGITIQAEDLLCWCDHIDAARGVHWVSPIFLVTGYTGIPHVAEPAKHGGLDWFPLDALPDAVTTPTRAAVAALKQRLDAR